MWTGKTSVAYGIVNSNWGLIRRSLCSEGYWECHQNNKMVNCTYKIFISIKYWWSDIQKDLWAAHGRRLICSACCRRGSIHLLPSTGLWILQGRNCDLWELRSVQWQNTICCLWSEGNKWVNAVGVLNSWGRCYIHSNPKESRKVLFLLLYFDLYFATLAHEDVSEIYFSKYVPWDCLWMIWAQPGNWACSSCSDL